MPRFLQAIFLATLANFTFATHVWAHAHLLSSDPADKMVVASPAKLKLTFSEGLNLKFTGVKLAGPNANDVALGEGALSDDGKTLTMPVSKNLAQGVYTVDWHALSVDGHKTSGSYSFTIAP